MILSCVNVGRSVALIGLGIARGSANSANKHYVLLMY